MKKILIIRFSSIGDIVLTSPVVRCIKLQTHAKVHFLIKEQYVSILESNPYVDKIIPVNKSLTKLVQLLRMEQYDYVVDLQNSFRSYWLKIRLNNNSYTVNKQNWKKFLSIYFGINLLKDHVVDRYFKTIKSLNIVNDFKGLDYFICDDLNLDVIVSGKFLVWCIGASYEQKTLSINQIVQVCNNLTIPCLLLGGNNEFTKGEMIIQETTNNSIFNMCGKLSLDESAYYIKKSEVVLTGDTGLMHIAAAFHKKIISFWGCTKPLLGFSPYMPANTSFQLVFAPNKRPCSKHGNYCQLTKDGCVKKIESEEIKKVIIDYCN